MRIECEKGFIAIFFVCLWCEKQGVQQNESTRKELNVCYLVQASQDVHVFGSWGRY